MIRSSSDLTQGIETTDNTLDPMEEMMQGGEVAVAAPDAPADGGGNRGGGPEGGGPEGGGPGGM